MTQLNTNPIEQRKCARLDIALSVHYAVKNQGSECSELAEALSSDISSSGIRLMAPTKLNPGDKLDLEIAVNGDQKNCIRASGEVVWQNKLANNSYETGTIIRHMEEADKGRFMAFIFDQMSRLVGDIKTSAPSHEHLH